MAELSTSKSNSSSLILTIPINQQLSSPTPPLRGYRLAGLIFPEMTGTTISFLVGESENLMKDLYDRSNNLISYGIGTNRAIALPVTEFFPWTRVVLKSGATEAAARAITVILAPVLG